MMDANVNDERSPERRKRSEGGDARSLIALSPTALAPTALALIGLSGLLACSEAAEAEVEPSVLLVTLDTTRADILGCYGGPPGATITLDTLADEGVLYEMAHTTAPVTMPAHTSMLTGLYPIRHAVRGNDVWALPEGVETLAEKARARNIQTAAVIAAVVLHGRFGLDRGFDYYGQPEITGSSTGHAYAERSATEVIDEALQWYEGRDLTRPFFLWVHLFDPHVPYAPPPEFRSDFYGGNPYLGEVGYADRETGRLIERMRADGVLDSTFVLVMGDHGEGLGAHGEMSHGVLAHQPTLRVPLILRYPDGYRAGERSQEMVSAVDVFPTLAEALKLTASTEIDGLSLYRKTVPADRGIYFESYEGFMGFGYSPLVGWMDSRGKYTYSSTPLFHDIGADPQEITNLLDEKAAVIGEFREKIRELAAMPCRKPTTSEGMDDETLAALQNLGYAALGDVSLEFPGPLEETGLPSGTDAIEIHRQVVEGLAAYHLGEFARGEELLSAVVEALPHNPAALLYLGYCRINQLRHADAIAPLKTLVELRPALPFGHFYLGVCYGAGERNTEAIECLEQAILLSPTTKEYYRIIIPLLIKEERIDEARKFDRTFELLDKQQ
jgi:arylsulfatase A-like enzyme